MWPERFRISVAEVEQALAASCFSCSRRVNCGSKPGRDEKVLTEWNGLMIHALAECGVVLGRSDARGRRRRKLPTLSSQQMSQADGRLLRSYKDGRARLNAYLEDYAVVDPWAAGPL